MKTSAYVLQQGQRKDFEGTELAEMKASAIPFEESYSWLKKEGVTLDGIETINGKAYAVSTANHTWLRWTTGLKLAGCKTMDQERKAPYYPSNQFW
jgi:hypothetical protein